MIFRTITDDITGANKSIGLFGLSLQNVKNKLQEIQVVGFKNAIFNSSTIDTSAIIAYNNEISKGATAQQALATASRNTNRATIALIESANGATISTEQLTAAQQASTLSSKALSMAIKTVSVAMNMIAFALIAKGIQLAADAIDHYVNRAKYAAEAMEEAQQKIDDAQSTLKTMSDTLSENKERFLELSQGVSKFSNNLRLSEEDYAEYLSISNELAELFPSLVSGYDDQGNALLAIGTNAEETNEKLQELLETQQAVAQQTLIDNMDDVANGIYYEVEDAKSSIESMKAELATLQQQYKEFNIDIASSNGVINFSDDDYSKYGKAMEDALTSAGIEFEKNASAGLYSTAIQLVSASPEQLQQAQDFYDAWLATENEYFHASENGLKQDIEEKEQSIENSYSKMTANLQAWMKDNYNYQYLSDSASELADALVPEIKWDELENAPTTAWDYQNYVEENIIKPLMEVPQEHKQEIDNMFQQLLSFEDGDLDVLKFAEKLQARLNELGISIDITPIIADEQEARDKLQNSIESIAEGGSADFTTSSGLKVDASDYQKLQDYTKDFNTEQAELWEKATLGAESATDAINKYEEALKSASLDDKIDVLSLDDAKSKILGDSEKGVTGLIDELTLLQEVLADTGDISQETYEKLLSCSKDYATAIRTENGRITLNTNKLKQVAKQRGIDTKATIKQTLALKKQEWLQWKNKIENYNGTLLDSIETKYDDIDALQAEITQYELLVNSLDNATSAFERFKAAQETGDQDMYDTTQDAFNVLKEYSSDSSSENYGKYNRDEFQEAAMLLMDTDTYKKALNAKDLTEYQKVVQGFVKSISPLFDKNNAKSASKLFDEVDKIIASGDVPVADKEWADRLGISKEAFNALKQLGNLYDYNNKEVFESFPLDKLDDYQEKVSNVAEEYKTLNSIEDKTSNEYLKQEQAYKQAKEKRDAFIEETTTDMSNAFTNYQKSGGMDGRTFADYVKDQFDFEDTDVTGSMFALIDKADTLKEKLNTISPNKDVQKQFAEYDELQMLVSVLDALGYKYEETANNSEKLNKSLEKTPTISRAEALEKDMKSFEKLKEQEKTLKEQMATSEFGSDMYTEAQAGLAQVQSQLEGLRESLKLKLELDISDVESKLQKTQEEKAQFQKSNAGLEGTMFYSLQMQSYNEQIERDTATKTELEQQLKLVLDTSEVDDYSPEEKELPVKATLDSSAVDGYTPPTGLEMKVKVKLDTTEADNYSPNGGSTGNGSNSTGGGGAYGTVNIGHGRAYANGNIGTDKPLKNVMVGEIQPEMVVDPHSGEYTIYQNPTMLDKLPKDAIVFNGKQTEEILKNGMTTSFGKAYATGTKVNIPNFNDVNNNNVAIKSAKQAEKAEEEAKELTEELFDWIERRIQKLQRYFDRWVSNAESVIDASETVKGLLWRYYKRASGELNRQMSTYSSAADRYMAEANKSGLSEEYKQKVRDGAIDLETITDETLSEQIKSYQELYDKATECLTAFEETATKRFNIPLDKCAHKMEIFGDAIEHIEKKLDNAIGYVAQNKLINQQTRQEKKKLFAYDVAYRETKNNLEEQSSSMLSSSILSSSDVSAKEKKEIKKAVKNGKEVNIEYFDETSKAYQQAVKYNAALRANQQATQDLADAQEEYDRWLVEAAKMKFDNVVTYYENTIKQFQNNFTDIDNKISEIEASGKRLDKSYYEEQKKINDTMLERYQNEHKKLEDRLSAIKEGTQEWYDAKDAIQECENAISECTKTTYELNNAITQLHYDMFDDIADGIGRIIDEQEFLQGLFAHEKLADDDTGGLTEAGIAKLGSLSASYYASKVKVNNDEKEVEILRNMLNNKLLSYSDGDFSLQFNSIEDLEAKYHEMYKTWQNDITKTYNLEKEVFDVMEQKYQAELAYVNELIDTKREALKAEKDLHDYQNSINEKVTDINTLQRQISAYQGDSSEEGMAKLHSLQKQLNDAQKDLQETEYDKYISDQQDMLEKLSTEYEEAITNQLEDFKSIVNKGFEIANNNLSSIGNYLSNVANANGYTEQYQVLFDSAAGTLNQNVNLATSKIVSAIKESNVDNDNDILGLDNTSSPPNATARETASQSDIDNFIAQSKGGAGKQGLESAQVTPTVVALNEKSDKAKLAEDYIRGNAKKIKNSKGNYKAQDYSALNQNIVKAYDGKALTSSQMKELAKLLGVTFDGAKKTGKLYKKLDKLNIPGFSRGGVVSIEDIEKQVKANGDTVLGSLNQGERVLTPVQNKLFEQFINNGIPELTATANMLQPMVNVPKLPEIQSRANNIEYGDISFNFELPNVSNSDEFLKAIQSDRKIQKAIQSVSIDRINGGSRLGVKSIR